MDVNDLTTALCKRFSHHHECCVHEPGNEYGECDWAWTQAMAGDLARFFVNYAREHGREATDTSREEADGPLIDHLLAIGRDECIHDDRDVFAVMRAVGRLRELERFVEKLAREDYRGNEPYHVTEARRLLSDNR